MKPGNYNIIAPQGSTYILNFTISTDGTPWDLTSYTARMQVRSSTNSSTTIISASTTAGTMTVNSSGQVGITISASTMASAKAGRWVYDIELESAGGVVYRVLQGRFAITPEVSI